MAKRSWLKVLRKSDPEPPVEPPIWLGNHSNGEYFHYQTPREAAIRDLILDKADAASRKLGMERRDFLSSAMGMATSLWAINLLGCSSDDENASGGSAGSGGGSGGSGGGSGGSGGGSGGSGGGSGGSGGSAGGCYDVSPESLHDEAKACAELGGNEFIFDIQTHHFDEDGDWRQLNQAYLTFLTIIGRTPADVSLERYIIEMFCDSDTTMAALSTWPAALCTDVRPTNCGLPLPNDEVAKSRDAANLAANSQRIVNHCQIMPNDPFGVDNQLRIMEEVACKYSVAAWKLYPAWGPAPDSGFWLDDPAIGIPVIEKGLELGVKVFCVHKGLPIPGFDVAHNFPTEIGRVAKAYPEAKFIIYHSAICAGASGFCSNPNEGPYDPANATAGTNTLIKSLEDNGIGANANVYAELGSAFSNVRSNPTMAAHFIGKLLRYVGEDNVCWGTDSILFGSPQGLIEAFRTLTISDQLQQQYGYPALTPAIKAKIFGLNAAKVYGVDPALKRCQAEQCATAHFRRELDGELGGRRWALTPQPHGPRTRREFFQLAQKHRAYKVPG